MVSLVLLAIALVLAAVMMLYGNTIYTPSEVWDALKEVEGSAVFTVKTLRLPRMLTAILAGFAFGIDVYKRQNVCRDHLRMILICVC